MLWWLRWESVASEALEDAGQQIEVGDHQGEDAVAKQAMYST